MMEAIRQTMKVPGSRELRITLPDHVAENQSVEVILLIGTEDNERQMKIAMMKEAMSDQLFLDDLKEVSEDFAHLDNEDWEKGHGV
jgi:hypothetical protein